jgi:hypothetical protein
MSGSGGSAEVASLPGRPVGKVRTAFRKWWSGVESVTVGELNQTIKKRWHLPVLGLATIAGYVAALFTMPWTLIPVGVGVAAFVIYSVRQLMVRQSYVELLRLKDRHDKEALDRQANFRVIFGALLAQLSSEVGLSDSNARVSGYSHTGKAFILAGRQSDNPKWKVSGRSVYAEDQGLIAHVWQEGRGSCASLPEDLEKYVAKMEKDFGLPPEVTKSLTMKSRSLVGLRVDDKATKSPVGVVIAESTRPRGVNQTTMKKIEESETWKTIVYLMVTSRELLPDMLGTSEKGF